jgi:peptide/nickel transport system permease protein/glutathione transport system permease protein
MFGYIVRRLMFIPVSLLLVTMAVFFILRATGDPVQLYLGVESTPEQVALLEKRLHLDKPLPVQYLIFLKEVVTGDFGVSLRFDEPALPLVLSRLVATVQLVSVGMLFAVILGVLGGIACAVWKDRPIDFIISSLAVAGQSIPSFWLGIMLISIFAIDLRWLPTSGTGSWKHLILPGVTLSTFLLPNFVLLTRTNFLETMTEQFVTTAKAKGLPQRKVLFKHILRNALNPVVTFLGLQVGRLLGGSIITETIFAWPGVGRLAVGSIFQRDVPVVEATVFLLSIFVILSSLLVDIAHSLIDPRIRIR